MQLIEIHDFSAPELDIYARLTEGQLMNRAEPEKGIFIAESPNVIMRALEAGYEPVSFLAETRLVEKEAADLIGRFSSCRGVPVFTADASVLRQLTGFPMTRGILCAIRRPPLPSVEEICRDARRIAILEEVENPTNVGAIFRSAAALGVDAVLLTPGSSNPLYRRASRVSMGTVFQVPWTFIPEQPRKRKKPLPPGMTEEVIPDQSWPAACMELLKGLGFKTAAMALSDESVPIDDPALNAEEKLAIVLGTEGDGLSSKTLARCDRSVKIPMAHHVDSLNVAAAAAVAFWELRKRT